MKTVIEMANAAGFLSFNVAGWAKEFAILEEMIRDDERNLAPKTCEKHCERNAYQIEIRRLNQCLFEMQNAAINLTQQQDHSVDAAKLVEPPKLRRAGSFGD